MKITSLLISHLFSSIFTFHQPSFAAEAINEESDFSSIEAYQKYRDRTISLWQKDVSSTDAPINVDEINGYPNADILVPGEVEELDDFVGSTNYILYRSQADELISEGKIVKMFFFAGLTKIHGKTKFSYLPEKDISSDAAGVMPVPLGIRYILQYRQQLQKLAKEQGKDPEAYLKKAKLILHLEEEDLSMIERDLKEFEWFNFSPANVVILIQPTNNIYQFENKKFISDSSVKRFDGHGYAAAQVVYRGLGNGYTFSSQGQLIPLSVSAAKYMRERGGEWLLSASVNDLTQMTPTTLDPKCLAIVLNLSKQGHNMMIEMAKNPNKRMGAYWVHSNQDRPFVIHTLQLLHGSSGVKRPLDYLADDNIMHSRFVHYIRLETLETVLSKANFPLYIEPDNMTSSYRLISFFHDLCRMPGINAAAFHQEGESIRIFRQEEDLPEVLAFMSRQDTDPYFKAEMKEIYLKRASKYLNQPLQFHTNCVKYPWGGMHIGELKNLPVLTEAKIGETWEISAQHRHPSYFILNGQIQPLTLEDLMNNPEIAQKIVGPRVLSVAKNWFPILYKFLDAKEVLSVQVHPSTKLTEELGEEEPGKSETWVVLDAKANACIYIGLKNSATYEQLVESIQHHEDLLPLMKKYPVKAGDVLTNIPGVIHAIGAGVFVAEIQGNSDITYRLYDHKRIPIRPVHIPQALKAIHMDLKQNYKHKPRMQSKVEQYTPFGSQVELVAEDAYYEVRRAHIKLHDHVSIDSKGDFQIVSVVSGHAILCTSSSKTLLCQGQTVLVTAITNPIVLETNDYETQVLLVKPGKNPQSVAKAQPIKFIKAETVAGPIHLAISVGGTKLALGALSSEGLIETSSRIEWRKLLERKGEYTAKDFIELIVDEFEKIVQILETKGISRSRIDEVDIAWPGPGEYAKGVVSATFIPGFYKYPLGGKLKERLMERLALNIQINVVLDAWADVYGEMAQDPTLKNWIYLNLATGVAVGIVKDGKILDNYCWPGKESVQSGLGQIGRHLIHLANGKWEYRPTQNGEIPPMMDGEIRLTDWIGGPALAKRFVDHILMKADMTDVIPSDFFGMPIKKLKPALIQKDAAAIQAVLSAVQERAKEKNELAIEMISEVGQDIGSALRVFADAFPQEFFYNRIIIGGGVGENLGKDIPAMKSNSDILLYNIIQASQIPNIRRTKMDVRRELLAFKPIISYPEPKLLVFDLDNTLYDASSLLAQYKEAAYEFYCHTYGGTKEEARFIIENKRLELASLGQASGDRDVIESLGLKFENLARYIKHSLGDQTLYVKSTDGLSELLIALSKRYRLVLATNNLKSVAVAILQKLEIEHLFEKIYAQDETGFHKPDPRLFKLIQAEMHVPFDQMVSIGDREEADIVPARQLGMQVLLIKDPKDLVTKIKPIFLSQLFSESDYNHAA